MTIWIVVVLLTFADMAFALQIKRNVDKRKLKMEQGKTVWGRVLSWKAFSGQPARYRIEVEYDRPEGMRRKSLITSGRFAMKYEEERNIRLVVIPHTNKVFLAEEDWKGQNICLAVLLIMTVPFMILLWLLALFQ